MMSHYQQYLYILHAFADPIVQLTETYPEREQQFIDHAVNLFTDELREMIKSVRTGKDFVSTSESVRRKQTPVNEIDKKIAHQLSIWN